MPNIGPTELIIILVIVLIIFGVGRLPEIGGAIGKSIREFRDAQGKDKDTEKKEPEKAKEEAGQSKEA